MNIEVSDTIIRFAIGAGLALVGTFSLIKNAKSPRVRVFLAKASIVAWIFTAAYLLGFHFLGERYEVLLTLIYIVGAVIGIRFIFRKQRQMLLVESKRAANT